MARAEILQLTGTIASILAGAMVATDRRLIRRLRGADAVSPETAIPIPARWLLVRLRLARLRGSGAVVESGSDRFYLDVAGYEAYRRARRRRAITLLAVLLPLILVVWWMSVRTAAAGESDARVSGVTTEVFPPQRK